MESSITLNKGSVQDIMRKVVVPNGEAFVLQPRDFVLAITEETSVSVIPRV